MECCKVGTLISAFTDITYMNEIRINARYGTHRGCFSYLLSDFLFNCSI